jgi:uncharacterized protein involved in exopolysaccharide biosynthesis/Mrp family chromosome partitioning ATPase
MSSHGAQNSVGLADYLVLLRRQWRVVVVGVVVGILVASAYLLVAPRQYTSATSVLVTASTTTATTAANRAAEINLDTEAQLVTSTDTVSDAAVLLGLPAEEVTELADRVMVTVPPNTDILTISFVAPTATEAQAGARAFAEAYLDARRSSTEAALDAEYDALQGRIDEVNEQLKALTEASAQLPANSPQRARSDNQAAALSNQLAGLGSQQNQVRASAVQPGRIVTQPGLPPTPSSPDVALTLLAGALLGLLLGIGLAALRHRADDHIRTADDLRRRTEVPVSAELTAPLQDGQVVLVPASSRDGRAYARLRNIVTSTLEQRPRRVVLVAGVRRGGGTVAANLAASIARAGDDVCLVSADVFGGTARSLLGSAPAPGLAEVLSGEQPVSRALRQVPGLPNMRVLGPSADPDRDDALLQTRNSRLLVDRLQEEVSYVVIEIPSTTDGTGAQTLAGAADLAVLVVETGSTTAAEIVDAMGQIATPQRPVVGAVVATYQQPGTAELAGSAGDAAAGGGTGESRSAGTALRVPAPGRSRDTAEVGPSAGRGAARS